MIEESKYVAEEEICSACARWYVVRYFQEKCDLKEMRVCYCPHCGYMGGYYSTFYLSITDTNFTSLKSKVMWVITYPDDPPFEEDIYYCSNDKWSKDIEQAILFDSEEAAKEAVLKINI